MSGNPVKNHGKKPQRNFPCKETRKRRYITRRNVFFLDLTSTHNTVQQLGYVNWLISHHLGRSQLCSQLLSNTTLGVSKAEIEVYLVQLNKSHCCQLRQVVNSQLPRQVARQLLRYILILSLLQHTTTITTSREVQ